MGLFKEKTHFAELTTRIHQFGYRKMPDGMYQNWLSGMKSGERDNLQGMEMSSTTVAQAKEHSPFVKYGYDRPMVFTASYGMFEEFHDFLDTVEIGNILFDCVNHTIVGFLSAEDIEVRADILPLSVDPHADRYWWVTPYAYCNNNPIKIVDPDGRDIITVDERGGITIEQCSGNDILTSTTTHKTKELSGNGVFRAEGVQWSQTKDEHGNLMGTSKNSPKIHRDVSYC
ncbi:MAG: hypothetical protein LBV02_07280 [Bacteroidales bacterium]|jgi:hypothetical protein|nr:hypothetical protein [Bacteroidales bacterium]